MSIFIYSTDSHKQTNRQYKVTNGSIGQKMRLTFVILSKIYDYDRSGFGSFFFCVLHAYEFEIDEYAYPTQLSPLRFR